MADELKPCPFCNLLKQMKTIDARFSRNSANEYNVYKAGLTQETYLNNERIGKITHQAFELNFCPVCGKKINQDKEDKNARSKTD